MEYMLYKHAEEGDTPASSSADAAGGDGTQVNKKRLVQALSAVGGGTLGYLLTRYGMGLKGAAAGITGAGIGSMAGLAGGSILADAAVQEDERKESMQEAIERNKAIAEENPLQTFWRKLKNPWVTGTGAVTGGGIGAFGIRDAALRRRLVADAYADFLGAPARITANRSARQVAQELADRWSGRLSSDMAADLAARVSNDRALRANSRRWTTALNEIANQAVPEQRAGRLLHGQRLLRGVRGAVGGTVAAPILLALYDRTIANPKRIKWLREQGVSVD